MASENAHESLVTENTDKKIGGPKQLWAWFMKDPCSRWPLMFFVAILILSLIFLILFPIDSSDAFYGAGVVCVIMAGFGTWHFKVLMKLKEEVDRFKRLNAQFKKEHTMIKQEINKIENANNELVQTSERLNECNKRNRENLVKFRQLSDNLSKFGSGNVKEMNKVQQEVSKMKLKWEEQLVKHERDILHKVFDALELKDSEADMTEDEFKQFLSHLPEKYTARFTKLGKDFHHWAGDDNKLNIDEFKNLLDEWAKEYALK